MPVLPLALLSPTRSGTLLARSDRASRLCYGSRLTRSFILHSKWPAYLVLPN